MSKYLTINENKQILNYYKKKHPKTIHGIKKKVSVLIFKKMCKTNCDTDEKFKKFLSIVYKKRMISPNNKINMEILLNHIIHYLINIR
uniref:Uncharacterized protein n=1 Tax=Florenciella sp. virus SA2 TaxID=3240092 RepID=A0AB39JDR7_9VIRU